MTFSSCNIISVVFVFCTIIVAWSLFILVFSHLSICFFFCCSRGSPDRDRGRDRERSRRGDRPSRFSSNTRDRSPVRERRKNNDNKVYVSNVAYESKWQDIKDLFRNEGMLSNLIVSGFRIPIFYSWCINLFCLFFIAVGEVEHVQLFTDENDKPRGCGVVVFATPELAAKAVEKMHRYDLKGRKLVVKEVSVSAFALILGVSDLKYFLMKFVNSF